MKEVILSNWKDFEDSLERLYSERNTLADDITLPVSKPLFRGQSCSAWKLKTTLERYTDVKHSLKEYFSTSHPSVRDL